MPSLKARTRRVNRRLGAAVSSTDDRQLVVVVVHPRHLTPGLGPPLVVRLPGGVGDAESVAERRRPAELEAEQRGQDQRAPVAGEAVVQPAVADLHGDLVAPVGRGRRGPGLPVVRRLPRLRRTE